MAKKWHEMIFLSACHETIFSNYLLSEKQKQFVVYL